MDYSPCVASREVAIVSVFLRAR